MAPRHPLDPGTIHSYDLTQEGSVVLAHDYAKDVIKHYQPGHELSERIVDFIEAQPLFNLCVALPDPDPAKPDVWHCSSILSVLARDANNAAFKRLMNHHSVQLNMDDSNYSTPLSHVIMQGNAELFGLLLAHPDILLNTGVGPRDSPLFLCLYYNRLDFARELVQAAKDRGMGYLRMPGTPKDRDLFRKRTVDDLCNQKWMTDRAIAEQLVLEFYLTEEILA